MNQIPDILKKKGWTKYRLAMVTGISHPTILKIVNSKEGIPPRTDWETVKRIAKALEVKIDELEEQSMSDKKPSVVHYEQYKDVDLGSKNPKVRERRTELLKMWVEILEEGYTDAYLAEKFGVSESTIQKDRRVIGMLFD